ncbi:MAG: saccharopine dehydrogenase NADP-binding domain-containing protein [Planctomycetota bacterium]|nr:saccharopine dehydrogenase NADP-binding domain-containing protein [Planctomycetota bacterium]
MTESTKRRFDIVLWGASGFTGRLVAQYLFDHGPKDLRWALAGRNKSKLETIRTGLGASADSIPILLGDSGDRESLIEMARETTVVCSTVGPYMKYGSDLVAACVETKTHYCDLTGETPWIRQMIDTHHEAAKQNGTRIVHCCGFDSIPSDMGVFMLGEEALRRGQTLNEIKAYVGEMKGGVSGGTVASLIGILEDAKNPEMRRVLGNPYGLNPAGETKGPDKSDQMSVGFDSDLKMWTAPFVMAAINTRIARRSLALRGHPYGKDLRYSEAMSTGRGSRGWLRAGMTTFGLGAFVVSLKLPLVNRLVHKFLPKPGEGPSKEDRENGFFVMRIIGKGEDKDGQPQTLFGRVEGKQDPGYGETAKMLSESALCLAFDQENLPKIAGVLTPSTAMGTVLLERLRRAGMVFEIREKP